MNKTKVKFYRGTKGMGIVISVTYNKDRIIFDFGAPFTPLAEIYDGTVKPRYTNRVKDSLLLGRAPYTEGVYKKEDLEDIELPAYEDSDLNTAVFICHLHLDHMSEIDKVHPSIPVYIHKDGVEMQKLIDAMEKNKIYREYQSFEYNKTICVGSIQVTPYFSDHPCAGAASFLIKTPDATILYSGDIRYHGQHSERAFASMEEIAQNNDVDLLIVDATTTSPTEFIQSEENILKYQTPNKDLLPGEITEDQIYEDTYNSLNGFQGIGVFNQYPRDLNMLINMHKLGERLNRTTVFEPYYANILYKLSGIVPTIITNTGKEDLLMDYPSVSLEQICKEPEKYLLQNSYRHILNLIDLDGTKGKYFHLLGEPLVEGTKEYGVMVNFVNKLNWDFKTYINLYSFSHAYPNHLSYVLDTIRPKTVVAVHSKHPENLKPVNTVQFFPEENTEYILENGVLKEA